MAQFYLHTPRSSANEMNHTCLCLSSRSWSSFTDPGGKEGSVGLGWLVGTRNASHKCETASRQDVVAYYLSIYLRQHC